MRKSKITTAAFLAGATTLAVTLPSMADKRGPDGIRISSDISVEVDAGSEFLTNARMRPWVTDEVDVE